MEPINWHAMTPEQRNETIHEKVFGHQRRTEKREVPSRAGGMAFTASYTTWQTGGPDTPRYSQSLDAAWLLWPKLLGASYVVRSKFLCAYIENDDPERYKWTRYATCGFIELETVRHMTPERICIAMLRAFGYEVLTEEASQ